MSFITRSRVLLTRSTIRSLTVPARPVSSSPSISTNAFASLKFTASFQNKSFHTTPAKMGVHNVNSKVEFDAALKAKDVVVLDCFATWCGPCKAIAPQVVKLSEEYGDAHFIKIDVDEVPDVAQELAIRAMPTFIVFKNGEKVAEIVGANPPALKAAVEKYAGAAK